MPRSYIRKHKLNICNKAGCNRVTDGRFCTECLPTSKRKASPRTDRDRFLDSAKWRKLSKAKLNETPYCEECKKRDIVRPAKDVDHILPRSTHPHLALTWSNLQSLCPRHHGMKTGRGQ